MSIENLCRHCNGLGYDERTGLDCEHCDGEGVTSSTFQPKPKLKKFKELKEETISSNKNSIKDKRKEKSKNKYGE